MPVEPPVAGDVELAAALLQAAVTAALAVLCGFLFQRYRKPYFAWWSAAWALYLLRLGAILSFLTSGERSWLFWHQVVTGWTALALLGAALVFSRGFRWRWAYLPIALFPVVWSYIAIYRIDRFAWAAGPAVGFLSIATLWTGWVFLRYRFRVASTGAALLAAAFGLWGLHHLDYPFLRARGAWAPWGYYLDILFELAVGAGILLLVVDDLRRGLGALSALSGDLQRRGRAGDVLDGLLARPLTLPAVTGSALYLLDGAGGGRFVHGHGVAAPWTDIHPTGAAAAVLAQAVAAGRPRVTNDWVDPCPERAARYAYAAVLPVLTGDVVTGALIIVGDTRDPFTALDDGFLVALGQQVGAALENAELYERLQARTVELGRLSARMVEQHEEERRRLSRELHDETAQVFSAVKMELGVVRESAAPPAVQRLDRALELVDAGIRSIRNVTNELRPSLLDDLGLLPALRSLVAEFGDRSGLAVALDAPPALPQISKEAEVALFRALQEALSNIARHAGARAVEVAIGVRGDGLVLAVCDDGSGFPGSAAGRELERNGHMGLAGMRERISALGGTVVVESRPGAGARVEVRVPAPAGARG
ncbi:MAG TPA: GAF domain-containing sensor histidine kinase [Gemmatimonadales bacterium]|nr:GAF domain-containing sensor histidine kinase [Gemmatimonadales bacterium]